MDRRTFLAAISGGCCALWPRKPDLALLPVITKKGPPRLEVRQHGINTCDTVLFWSASKSVPLWGFSINPLWAKDLRYIIYGTLPKVPEGSNLSHRFPEKGTPRSLVSGERVGVSIDYQYDWLVPCGENRHFCFRVQKDGSLKALPELSIEQLPDRVYKAFNTLCSGW